MNAQFLRAPEIHKGYSSNDRKREQLFESMHVQQGPHLKLTFERPSYIAQVGEDTMVLKRRDE